MTRLTSSRPAIVVICILIAVAIVGVFDTAANWGKAFGNVSINGIDVSGKTSDEIRDTLKNEFGSRVSHAQITIYANDEAMALGEQSEAESKANNAVAEQVAVEDAYDAVQSWKADALTLKATIPYDDVIGQAMAVGRANGGVMERISLLFNKHEVPFEVRFDEASLEELASNIDLAIGDPRIDATVSIEGGEAHPVEGHSGTMVDRVWLKEMISRAMVNGDVPDDFVARVTEAQSRISADQATDMAASINRAISEGVVFNYKGHTWLAGPAVLGDWTNVGVEGEEGSWHLAPSIDSSAAIPVVVDKLDAEITTKDVVVTFEDSDSDVVVHTAGTGNIPEVSQAVASLQEALYGEGGIAWGSAAGKAPEIQVEESDRPETLPFEDAVNLGVITVVGEFTTEFSDVEGTENRNHNIKLAADILNNGIIEGNGGSWSFNDRSGNTNEEAGFWTAGSIVEGEYVDSVGGGICQVATTIFNAVLESGVEVLERHNHTLFIASYPTGRDAAVDYPSDLDLMWRNGLESDMLLKMSYTDTSLTAKLYSVYTGYTSEYSLGDWEEGAKYKTVFKTDDSLGEGAYYRQTIGEDGSKITMYRTVNDDNGKTVRSDAFQSNYDAKDEVYMVGPGVDTSKLGSNANS